MELRLHLGEGCEYNEIDNDLTDLSQLRHVMVRLEIKKIIIKLISENERQYKGKVAK